MYTTCTCTCTYMYMYTVYIYLHNSIYMYMYHCASEKLIYGGAKQVMLYDMCLYMYMYMYMYSRGQKKVNTSFPCDEEFRFVSFSFRFRFVSVLSRRNFKIDRLRSHFPFCVFRFSVFPCLTKNATGERADRREPREPSIVKATRSPRLRFLARKAFRVL